METHTVFGAGQIGVLLARSLASRGFDVRLVRRGPAGEAIEGVTWMSGDVLDPTFAAGAAAGSNVVYNCTNPQYHRWATDLEPLYSAVWNAAATAGARLVQLDNLYAYGAPASPFDENTPENPCSKKGTIRKRVIDALREMHARGAIEMTIGRASDFFGPDTTQGAVFRPDVYARIQRGASVWTFGDPEQPHGYSYTPDVAEGLAMLGTHPAAVGRTWHLPLAFTGSTRELVERFASVAGTSPRVRRVPDSLLRAAGWVVPLARELAEMTYQWELPYVPDDTAFVRAFGVHATPIDEAIRRTLGSSVTLEDVKAAVGFDQRTHVPDAQAGGVRTQAAR